MTGQGVASTVHCIRSVIGRAAVMRCLVSSFHALNRRTLAKTGGQHQHKIYAMSAATSRRATTQVSEFAQRQLNEGVIDMAAGQVSCKRSPPPPAWRIGGRGMPCAQALQHSWVDICYPASSWLCHQTIHLIDVAAWTRPAAPPAHRSSCCRPLDRSKGRPIHPAGDHAAANCAQLASGRA